jgi:hypothetical protein
MSGRDAQKPVMTYRTPSTELLSEDNPLTGIETFCLTAREMDKSWWQSCRYQSKTVLTQILLFDDHADHRFVVL